MVIRRPFTEIDVCCIVSRMTSPNRDTRMERYDPKNIEPKWQKKWADDGLYATREDQAKPKYYILDMFPYPSGAGLHVGHPKGYIATDIFARAKTMQGYNVLHPMGWDAFGLPAENYAIKNNVHPRVAVEKNIATFKSQLAKLGFSYDWDREIDTTDPKFYKWTQWVFLKMFEKGLAYESYEPIIWCPSCQTGLAAEDLEGGVCERCGSEVERKPMRQWVLKITDYAERMLADIDKLPEWEESIKEMQRNWIGKSEGAEVDFEILGRNVRVFTTRPDTLFGATYFVLAPEHPLILELKESITNYDDVQAYIKKAQKKSDLERTDLSKEKTGVELKGVTAKNPVNGKDIPVWIADYVLIGYGTGAIMAVPAHDERDFEFSEKFAIPRAKVVEPASSFVVTITRSLSKEFYEKVGRFAKVEVGTGTWDGLTRIHTEEIDAVFDLAKDHFDGSPWYIHSEGPQKKILVHSAEKGDKVFDWSDDKAFKAAYEFGLACGISETQLDFKGSYAAFCESGVAFDSSFLDGLSTKDAKTKMIAWLEEKKSGARAINYKLNDWVFSRQRYWGEPIPIIHCEKCGTVAVPEKDLPVTLPDVEKYEPTGTGESPLAAISEWVNTTCPTCGGPAKRETNTMPQWAGSSWYYLRYIDPRNDVALVDPKKEAYWSPVDFYVGGAEHATRHLIYARFWHKFLYDIGAVSHDEPFTRLQHVGLILAEDGRKMSKRWGNVINPDDVIESFGADAMRVYEMFMGPFSQSCAWNTNGLAGTRRFLEKVWRAAERVEDNVSNDMLERLVHRTIKKVGEDIEDFKMNTAVAQMMICVNELESLPAIPKTAFLDLLKILAPFAPHMSEELWSRLGQKGSICLAPWPVYDPEKLVSETTTIVVQVNGKVRDTIEVPVDISEPDLRKVALASEKVTRWTEGKEPAKVIYVKGRLINIVVPTD